MRKDMEKGIRGDEALRTMQKFFDGLDQRLKDNPKLWEKYLDSLKSSQDGFRREWEIFMAMFFQSGFEEGMTKIFNRLAKFLKENPQLAAALGRAFNALADAITVVLDTIQVALNWWYGLDQSTRDMITGILKLIATLFIVGRVVKWVFGLFSSLWGLVKGFIELPMVQKLLTAIGTGAVYLFGGSNEPPQQQAPTSYGAEDAMSTLNPSTTTNNTNNATTNNVTVYQTNSIESVASSEELHTALSDWSKKAQTSFPRTQ